MTCLLVSVLLNVSHSRTNQAIQNQKPAQHTTPATRSKEDQTPFSLLYISPSLGTSWLSSLESSSSGPPGFPLSSLPHLAL